MSAAARKSSGATCWIGTQAANGATDTYVEIKRARQVGGAVGGAWNMADSTSVSDTVKQTTKTIIDPSDIDLDINEMPDDPGQIALEAAFRDESDEPYNFEIRYKQGDKRRCKIKVAQFQPSVGGGTALRMAKSKLMLAELPVYIPAA